MDDFNGHDGYMKHAESIPRDIDGNIMEMNGDIKSLCSYHFGPKYYSITRLTEQQLRQ